MKFHRKFLLLSFTLLFLFNLGWNLWLYTLPTHDTSWNYWYNISYGCIFLVGGGLSVYYGIKYGLKTNLGKMLVFLGLSLLSFWVGNIIWVYYTFVLNVEIPFPSAADFAYGALYPLMLIGCFYLVKIYQSLLTKAIIRDSILIALFSFAFIFGLFARPDVSEGLPLIQKFINVYYPAGDVMIMSVALMALRIGGGKIHPSLYIFSAGVLLQTAGDLLFTYRNAKGEYWNGDIADLLYTFSAFVISVGLFEIINSLNQAAPITNPTQSVATVQPPVAQAPIPAPATAAEPKQP